MTDFRNNILVRSMIDIFHVCKREFRLVFHDMGVVIFFLLLPTAYPIVYSLIYNPEIAREIPVTVVDDCRSEVSREYVRNLDASQYLHVAHYAANLQDARRSMDNKDCYGIVYFPEDFSKNIARGEQSNVTLYADMSLLLRYKGLLMAMTDVASEMGAKVTAQDMQNIAVSYSTGKQPINNSSISMGNTAMGLASALLPGILVLILQQSLILGVCMLAAGSRERASANGGCDPMAIRTGLLNQMIGKAICYYTIYIIPTIYILHYVPIFFSFPQNGHAVDMAAFMLPYLLSSIFMGMSLQVLVRERESSFLVIVFTSIIFMFLSGLSWPRFAMSRFWYLIGDCIPSTWAVNGYIAMKSNGADLEQMSHPYSMLWLLVAVYFILAYCIQRFAEPSRIRQNP